MTIRTISVDPVLWFLSGVCLFLSGFFVGLWVRGVFF